MSALFSSILIDIDNNHGNVLDKFISLFKLIGIFSLNVSSTFFTQLIMIKT